MTVERQLKFIPSSWYKPFFKKGYWLLSIEVKVDVANSPLGKFQYGVDIRWFYVIIVSFRKWYSTFVMWEPALILGDVSL